MIAYFYTGTLFGTNAPLLIPQDNSLSSSGNSSFRNKLVITYRRKPISIPENGMNVCAVCWKVVDVWCVLAGSVCVCVCECVLPGGGSVVFFILGWCCFFGMWLCLVEAEAKACSEKISTKRQPEGPKPGFMVEGASLETVTHIPYDVVTDLKGGY
ncbi:hypothetical protein IFM89_033652 [Coptis chinensis]|uniref:Uncharacterized protein n=1 Tax=Coptis chinensis TaxID=261450 RepID=A0A835LPV6_9MAGN|nr:hypothetical protein IFM89_033652 [Coptis chinensis]